jgi:DNA-binding NtrC family response regulator
MPTVLLVDDELMILDLCSEILAIIRGLCILRADSARRAIEIASRHPATIELLLSDILMPGGMNGAELAEELMRSRPEIKVVLMSGYTPHDIELKGAWHLLRKPFHPTELVTMVETILGGQQQPGANQLLPCSQGAVSSGIRSGEDISKR